MLSARVIGDKDVQRALRAGRDKLQQAVRMAVKEAALEVDNVAKQLAPVDTGRLRSSIGYEIDDDGTNATITAATEYAEHVEYGTQSMIEQPFMGPALENVRQGWRDIIAKHARRVTGGA